MSAVVAESCRLFRNEATITGEKARPKLARVHRHSTVKLERTSVRIGRFERQPEHEERRQNEPGAVGSGAAAAHRVPPAVSSASTRQAAAGNELDRHPSLEATDRPW